MSLANVGLKSRPPGVNISGAVHLMETLDIENLSNTTAFSPKSVRQARGGVSLLIKTLAWSVSIQHNDGISQCGEYLPLEYSHVSDRPCAGIANRRLRRPAETG